MSRRHPIRVVSRRTGLSPHVIRVWERRYGAVSPSRTPSNRRLYGETDIRRLILIRHLVANGHGVGQVAKLATRSLLHMASREQMSLPSAPIPGGRIAGQSPPAMIQSAVERICELDAAGLERLLFQCATTFSKPVLLEKILCPLMRELGEGWAEGRYRILHEHMASSIVRGLLVHLEQTHSLRNGGPGLIVATPSGQLHDIGALMAGLVASMQGWHVVQLGANIPADEMAVAAEMIRARAVAISLVSPRGDAGVVAEIRRLRALLPDSVYMLAGGRALASYKGALDEVRARSFPDLTSFRHALDELTWSAD